MRKIMSLTVEVTGESMSEVDSLVISLAHDALSDMSNDSSGSSVSARDTSGNVIGTASWASETSADGSAIKELTDSLPEDTSRASRTGEGSTSKGLLGRLLGR